MSIIGIVAISKNLAIGKGGKLPWHYSADMRFFKSVTLHNAVLMGANTWRSIGKALPKRLNIVLSRTLDDDSATGAVILRTRLEVLTLSNYLNCDLFVMGGAKTYECFADAIEKWIVTEVPVDVPGADVFLPEGFLDGFYPTESREIGEGLTISTYRKKAG